MGMEYFMPEIFSSPNVLEGLTFLVEIQNHNGEA
jgi:hypothetical protein